MRRLLAALTVLPLLLLGTAACGNDGGDTTETPEGISGVDISGKFGELPKVTIEKPLELEKTETAVLIQGKGSPAVAGKDALLHLYAANGTNGKKVLTTHDQGVPYGLKLTEEQLFPSVIEAIDGQKVGSRVVVAATPEDAYGDQGAPQADLAGDDNVVFVVDIMSVYPTEVIDAPDGESATDLPAGLPTVVEKDGVVTGLDFSTAPAKPSKKLQVVTLIEGDGPPARDQSYVTFDYLGQVYGTDNVFDESFSSEPRTFAVGINGLIKAWDETLGGVKRGSRLMIIAPPASGYGSEGNEGAGIKGTDTLVFIVDVLGVDPAP